MKKLFTLAALLCALSPSRAQETGNLHDEDDGNEKKVVSTFNIPTEKGKIMLGSNFVLGHVDFQENRDAVYNIGFSPRIGVFVANNIALGVSLNGQTIGEEDVSTTTYGAAAFMRAYFSRNPVTRAHRLQFFTEVGAGIAGIQTHDGDDDDVTTEGQFYAMPGINFFLNRHVALEFGAQYAFITGDPTTHRIGWNMGFQVFLRHNEDQP